MATRRILLVEGVDDEHVFKALFGRHNLPHLDEVKQHGGYDPLIEAFPVRLLESDLQSLGVVVDADTDAAARWDAVRHRLVQAGYQGVPTTPDAAGTIVEAPPDTILPKVGVWIMPDNKIPGILESFLHHLVPQNDALFGYGSKCIEKIPKSLRLFRDVDLPKVRIHTWLAWQEEPGKPLGQSITKGVLDAHSPLAETVTEWLKNLFFS